MNKTHLKRYAPQARKDFIATVTGRAQLLGLSLGTGSAAGLVIAEPCTVQGDVALIAGRAWPARVQGQREALLQRMRRDGFAATLEAVAYTWFNRLAALRFMELHDYLGHGRRVLSNAEGGLPEVLAHALELAEAGHLPGLKADKVRELKLANHDGELYRRVLLAQCNALHSAMPFLFEQLDDETELLLPDNLLLSDAIVAKLVAEIPEEDWTEVEVIGWLYQFYISEKKDQVIGKVVKSEDIPAATQLFTPNWIVQYLVQNSVGRLWLMANPQSALAKVWPYYIQPAEQTPEVQAQLDALIQTRIREDGEALNPETITVLDPACGSGHILVVAYDVLKAIYLERGYQPRAIPRLILEKNLYGLDIDDRAAQLAAFALLMKARADDRRLFNDPPKLNVLSLRESKGLDLDESATHLAPFGLQRAPLKALIDTFEHAKTFGSLIQIPAGLNGQLTAMTDGLQQALQHGDLYAREAGRDLLPLVWQALVLGMQFDAVVANPPYMGGKGMNPTLKDFVKSFHATGSADLFSAFVMNGILRCKLNGSISMVTMQNWMFLSSFLEMRLAILGNHCINSLVHIGYNSFPELNSKVAQACAFNIARSSVGNYRGKFIDLNTAPQSADKGKIFIDRAIELTYSVPQFEFNEVDGSPIAYTITDNLRALFTERSTGDILKSEGQILTGNNEKYLRQVWEVDCSRVGRDLDWKLHHKGGDFCRWYGNVDWVVAWDVATLKYYREDRTARLPRRELWDIEGVTWSTVTSSLPSFRFVKGDESFNKAAPTLISRSTDDIKVAMATLNSKISATLLNAINPTLNCLVEDVERMPFLEPTSARAGIIRVVDRCIAMAEDSWDLNECSFRFKRNILCEISSRPTLASAFREWELFASSNIREVKSLEEENNSLLIAAYGLFDDIVPDVPEDQITLARADREKDCQRLISYAIGCMMGRYSLDEPGLIYAHAGNIGFDPSRYDQKFPADADGIVPITEDRWFEDDAASRVSEFLRAVWGADTLDENLAWLAESLGTKGTETPDETLRRYLAGKFFKDHLQTYKKRPIYWLFSSGKQGAFQALVYLHRYHEGTLARLRAEYVLPLTGKMQARIDSLQADIRAASSTPARNKLAKQLESLRKQQLELLAYDEKLRHHADQRITLDLDDGVKVNYGKFGDLLAEVKAVTGGVSDD
jgi:hypothetical protein